MRFALGTPAPARRMIIQVIQPLMPPVSSGFGGALLSATSTSPFGKTYTVRGWSSPVAKALTAMPLAATGLPPTGQPTAGAILTVGIQDFCGGGRIGEGPNVCSTLMLSWSLQAASGSASAPRHIASRIFLRISAPRISQYNTENRRIFVVSATKSV